jgi:hypothetical protein
MSGTKKKLSHRRYPSPFLACHTEAKAAETAFIFHSSRRKWEIMNDVERFRRKQSARAAPS